MTRLGTTTKQFTPKIPVVARLPFLNEIICGDAVSVMKQIPSGSVDLVITSPPYNLKNSTGNGMKDPDRAIALAPKFEETAPTLEAVRAAIRA